MNHADIVPTMIRRMKFDSSARVTLVRLFVGLFFLLTVLFAHRAFAQTGPYENTASGTVNESTTPCPGSHLIRNVTVGDSFIIADVDIGLLLIHTYRGDIQATLTSPANTTVTLLSPDGSNPLQNYNVRFDDEAGNDVNLAPHNTDDGFSAPPYENNVRPIGNLSDFDGENAQGTWILDVCDNFSGDSGTYERANLYFTTNTDADVKVSAATSSQSPNEGSFVTLTYTVTNDGPLQATGLTAQISLPFGLTYDSDNGAGIYNSATGVWTLPAGLNAGASSSLQIVVFVETSGGYTSDFELLSANEPDPDSTPGNGSTTEDDDASLTLTPGSNGIPSLTCPGAPSVLDWDSQGWPAGSLTNSYVVDGVDVDIGFSDPSNGLVNDPISGNASPHAGTTYTGGLLPTEQSIITFADFASKTDVITISFDIGTPGIGVSKFQLTAFDIDRTNARYEDQLVINGSFAGIPVTPTVTDGTANSHVITGSTATITGTSESLQTDGAGNTTIRFESSIDTLSVTYGNGAGGPNNPRTQGFGIFDVSFCDPALAELAVTKSVSVWDPGAAGLYALPGNDVAYTISATNSGNRSADANSIFLIDPISSDVEFYHGDIDDGGPETDPVSFTQTSAGLTFTYATDVAYSNAVTNPADFASCTYSPAAGYDPNVTYICVNPKGSMAAGDPDPTFAISFRVRIK